MPRHTGCRNRSAVPLDDAFHQRKPDPGDLSNAVLRSVSPIHLEYMRNMGTGSSMSISILVNGALWGLVSGHSREPRYVNAQIRTACDILGQILSLHIDTRTQARLTAERLELKQVETDLLSRLAGSAAFSQGLAENAGTWMALTRAQGAAVITQGRVVAVGSTPPETDILALAGALHECRREVFATESMAETWPKAASFAASASGLLAVSISQSHADYILWFRPEVERTVEWGGDPTTPVEPRSDRLHPRKSFEL